MTQVIAVEGLGVTFAGFRALSEVSFAIGMSGITSVIGPNGAGKTTLFNLITGLNRPTTGTIRFEGRDLRGVSAASRVRGGMVRSFQRTNVFREMTARDNVACALMAVRRRYWNPLTGPLALEREEADGWLAKVGLSKFAETTASEMSHGDQKLLDLALALVYTPRLLLLDEPTAGMSSEETRRVIGLIENLVRNDGLTLFFTEHDMEVVFGISDRILGHKLINGIPKFSEQ
ncbi:MAG: ATP-binding cassette domain-containing protein [Hyphomicrobium aestuarii]|nr:ATP-binding cassette domain-containing protein [Hyphomicrobium aestuarii]